MKYLFCLLKHGLLSPEKTIEPYDLTLEGASRGSVKTVGRLMFLGSWRRCQMFAEISSSFWLERDIERAFNSLPRLVHSSA